ncbi:MAG: SUMF1/EgtB/PvdO family nonheme iron enzyme [Planctomycetia bacterium]|nr:SUMF1/EgtB/PvdO family nonheme iron enzyme [Planctomycetia bacterium]
MNTSKNKFNKSLFLLDKGEFDRALALLEELIQPSGDKEYEDYVYQLQAYCVLIEFYYQEEKLQQAQAYLNQLNDFLDSLDDPELDDFQELAEETLEPLEEIISELSNLPDACDNNPSVAEDENQSSESKNITDSDAGKRLTKTVAGIEFAFRWCPPGAFIMGSPRNEKDRGAYETQHQVTLSKGFWMQETHVTVKMFKTFMENTGFQIIPDRHKCVGWIKEGIPLKVFDKTEFSWEKPGYTLNEHYPITCVSFYDAQAFCKWLGKELNAPCQLPSEAQWEYACRAGTTTPFSFGRILNGEQANCNGKVPYGTNTKGPYLAQPSEVGSYQPNLWGIFDMHGNVEEWCLDSFGKLSKKAVTDPVVNKDANKIVRGGEFSECASNCRSAHRCYCSPESRMFSIGFRCILQAPLDFS